MIKSLLKSILAYFLGLSVWSIGTGIYDSMTTFNETEGVGPFKLFWNSLLQNLVDGVIQHFLIFVIFITVALLIKGKHYQSIIKESMIVSGLFILANFVIMVAHYIRVGTLEMGLKAIAIQESMILIRLIPLAILIGLFYYAINHDRHFDTYDELEEAEVEDVLEDRDVTSHMAKIEEIAKTSNLQPDLVEPTEKNISEEVLNTSSKETIKEETTN
ncbi:hypothetical protein OL233_06135 [Vagococcus sp. PNs007]|uniref:Uncharacterized protein n=1 Tax=Vagococcus proximus TaxID=2991417 RepID=A0ABT5X1J2_9ENTE|nr:hypothetical protein [Vagococcus proximus]MDF0479867.1 hypothetical protein [Vagococcus proximus]